MFKRFSKSRMSSNAMELVELIRIQQHSQLSKEIEHAIVIGKKNSDEALTIALHFWGRGFQRISLQLLKSCYSNNPKNILVVAAFCRALELLGANEQCNDIYLRALNVNDDARLRIEYGSFLHRTQGSLSANSIIRGLPAFADDWSDSDIYTLDFENQVWREYLRSARLSDPPPRENTGFTFSLYIQELMKVINEDTLGVIDIGVFCPPAFEELSLDSKFKRLKFVGLDRSKQILDWNDTAFNLRGDINYMPFSSGNFVPPKMNLEGFVAVHMRTATLMKRDEVQQMYTELYNLGVQTIVAIEFVGLSKKHMLFADFSGDESIPMRFPMTIHPLNRIANEAGFLAHLNFYKPKPIILQDFGLGESVGISIFQRK